MQLRALKPSCVAQALFVAMLAFSSTPGAQSPPAVPLVRENVTEKISDHVYVIPDASVPLVPNIGFVVGSKATLVIDTGMGRRNGDAVMRELAKVSKNSQWYVATTHFHPEHSMGTSFPAGTTFCLSESAAAELRRVRRRNGRHVFKAFARHRRPLAGREISARSPAL